MILSTRNQLYSSPFRRKAENKRAIERQGKRTVKKEWTWTGRGGFCRRSDDTQKMEKGVSKDNRFRVSNLESIWSHTLALNKNI